MPFTVLIPAESIFSRLNFNPNWVVMNLKVGGLSEMTSAVMLHKGALDMNIFGWESFVLILFLWRSRF